METTKNELPKNVKAFFYELSEYLDAKLYFFGSVQRSDFVPGKSDIDIALFTDNEQSLMNKMQHFLHVDKNDFEKVIWIINETTTYGYKVKYINEKDNIQSEFCIYNNKFKDIILNDHITKLDLPIYVSILLYILKFLYYKLSIFDKKTFAYFKRLILNGSANTKFLVLNNKTHK